MRIASGKLRGHRIGFRPAKGLRPTSEKVRQAVFDMLRGRLGEASVLDLFSGTGAFGMTALSEGAARAVFVEKDSCQCRQIRQSLEKLKLAERSEVLCADALAYLEKAPASGDYFDLVFLDPPYGDGSARRAIELLSRSSLCRGDGLVVAECRRNESLPKKAGTLCHLKTKIYGDTQILIYGFARTDDPETEAGSGA